MHIHIDTLGGASGNMFVGAVLNAFPELESELANQLVLAGFANMVNLHCNAKNDGVFQGSYFEVTEVAGEPADHHHELHHGHHHHHRKFSDIRKALETSTLQADVKENALGIFQLLAEAEATVHGVSVDEVSFHEVGAWDSIADVVCAAYLIAHLGSLSAGEMSWSISSLPMGKGTTRGAHGVIPLPAPAVVLLLQGFQFHDDGLEGERITPTGAAILKYLAPSQNTKLSGLKLAQTGFGFGSRCFEGCSNVLRLLIFDRDTVETEWLDETLIKINFEIDDQTPEDLAVALEQLREQGGVHDVKQWMVVGKKGRQAMAIEILASETEYKAVIRHAFLATSTIGLRYQRIERAILPRDEMTLAVETNDPAVTAIGVKKVLRPGRQASVKAEMDDIAKVSTTKSGRDTVRTEVEGRKK